MRIVIASGLINGVRVIDFRLFNQSLQLINTANAPRSESNGIGLGCCSIVLSGEKDVFQKICFYGNGHGLV